LWRPIAARPPRSGVPLAAAPAVPETLDVAVAEEDAGAAAWAAAPWASSVRHLRLRGETDGVLSFVAQLAKSSGLPGLRRLSLVVDAPGSAARLSDFSAAVRASPWLRGVLVTCHSNAPGDHDTGPADTVPAMAPENPGDLAWYACPPAVGRYRAFHVLPAD
jgi:hypothetical protein